MKSRRLIFWVVPGLALAATAAEPMATIPLPPTGVVLHDFTDTDRFAFGPGHTRAAPDGRGLFVETAGRSAGWTRFFRTRPGVLKPSTAYTVSFTCRSPGPVPGGAHFLHVIQRPFSAANGRHDTLEKNVSPSPRARFVKAGFRTGPQEDVSLQLHAHGDVTAEIANFRIVEGDAEVFVPFADPEQASRPAPRVDRPTGSAAFTIEPPRVTGGSTIHAADFGVAADNPDNTPALNRALAHCRAVGAARLEIGPGTYRMTSDDSVAFADLGDFTFDGGGAKFVFLKKKNPLFTVERCERVRLSRFAVDWDWDVDPLGSAVEVVGTGKGWVDLRFLGYDRFPRRDVVLININSLDPRTRSVGMEGAYERGFRNADLRPEWLSGNVLRIHDAGPYRLGQLYRIQHYYYHINGMMMRDNRHLLLEDIDVLSTPGHAFTVNGKQQYWAFRRVRIAPPPGDPRRAITCTADHLHIERSLGNMLIEDCEFSFGADDCVNAHDITQFADYIDRRTVRTRRTWKQVPEPGDRVALRFDDFAPALEGARVVERRPVDPKAGVYDFILDADVPPPPTGGEGFLLLNREYGTRNLVIRNSYFHDNRARGLLLLASDITVENNRFFHNDMGAIKIEAGYTRDSWCEGYGADNIVVRGNLFDTANPRGTRADGKARDIYLGVYMKTDPSTERTEYPILSNILFEDNTFLDSFGLVAFISSARNVVFRGNRIEQRTARQTPLPYRGGFHVTHAQDVHIVDNVVFPSPFQPNPGVFYDGDTTRNVVVAGNRPASATERANGAGAP